MVNLQYWRSLFFIVPKSSLGGATVWDLQYKMRATEEENKENEDFINIPTSFDCLWKNQGWNSTKRHHYRFKEFHYCNSRARIWYTWLNDPYLYFCVCLFSKVVLGYLLIPKCCKEHSAEIYRVRSLLKGLLKKL